MQDTTQKSRYSTIAAICYYILASVSIWLLFCALVRFCFNEVAFAEYLYYHPELETLYDCIWDRRWYSYVYRLTGWRGGELFYLLVESFFVVGLGISFLFHAIALAKNKKKGILVGSIIYVVLSTCTLLLDIPKFIVWRQSGIDYLPRFFVDCFAHLIFILLYVVIIFSLTTAFGKKFFARCWFILEILMVIIIANKKPVRSLIGYSWWWVSLVTNTLQVSALFFLSIWLKEENNKSSTFLPCENIVVSLKKGKNRGSVALKYFGLFIVLVSPLLASGVFNNLEGYKYYGYGIVGRFTWETIYDENFLKFFFGECFNPSCYYGWLLSLGISALILGAITKRLYGKREMAVSPDYVYAKLSRENVIKIPINQITGIYPCSFKGIKIDSHGAVICFYDIMNREEVITKLTEIRNGGNKL